MREKTELETESPPPIPIAFVKYYEKGSTVMGGDQIAEGLRDRGWDARSIPVRELASVTRGILVFIKTSRLDHLLLARARGNRLVLDVQDTVVFKRWIKNLWLYDALILKNRRQLVDFGRPGRADCLIYHQWDPRYSVNEAPQDRLALGYLGLSRSLALWGRLPEVEYVDDGYFEAAKRFNCHLSIRESGREFLYKPNCKVSTAAACDANLITTRDESTVELLGEDYPFYCEPERGSILATIERARSTFGSAEWHRGLERMRQVRELTGIGRVLDDYEALFRRLAPGLSRAA
ncbi:MAG TPA: hypothetical protein VGX68_25620 [Thermoanaerobaculia bacterium]|jgi:hypothetical protein|nr:hypothetical protein [Thermoanaerobaculia bacterium]